VSNLVDEVTRLHFLMPSLETHISSADEIAAHEEIAGAISAGDERRAARVMRDHLRTTHRILVDVFAVPRRAARG
jgi:DNA-binding GntR family transcriptional regulator